MIPHARLILFALGLFAGLFLAGAGVGAGRLLAEARRAVAGKETG